MKNKLLLVHFKVSKGNFFGVISSSSGKVLFKVSSGFLGFRHINKRTQEAFFNMLKFLLAFLLRLNQVRFICLKFEGIKFYHLSKIYSFFFTQLKKKKSV